MGYISCISTFIRRGTEFSPKTNRRHKYISVFSFSGNHRVLFNALKFLSTHGGGAQAHGSRDLIGSLA